MTPFVFYVRIMLPAATIVAATSKVLDSPKARTLMLAIAGQESAWTDRIQVPGGQARGFWQMERGGMVADVLMGLNAQTLAKVTANYNIPCTLDSLFEAVAWHDILSYAVARLGLYADPQPLPAVGDEDGAWATYTRVWRPGKPDRARWATIYPQAVTAAV